MQIHARRVGVIALLVGVALLSAGRQVSAQAGSAFFGVWELDRFKSTFEPIGTQPQKQLLTIQSTANAGEFRATTKTWRNEAAAETTYIAKFDGADYPTSAAQTLVSFKMINPTTVERTAKLFGEVAETATWTVSADGKMLTIKRKGTDTNGDPYSSMGYYIKVG